MNVDDRKKRIFSLALPVMVAMLSQNLVTLVDTAMVGPLGPDALAAVGVGSFILFLAHAGAIGLSAGVQTLTGRARGAGRNSELEQPLQAALMLVLVVAPVLVAALAAAAPTLVSMLNGDARVVAAATPYVELRALAIGFVAANFAFRGYWAATERPGTFLGVVLAMHGLNVFLNYVFIYGHLGFSPMGVAGAGAASAVAAMVGTVLHGMVLMRRGSGTRWLRRPTPAVLQPLLRLSVPTAAQQVLFATGFLATYWIIGLMGTRELAAAVVVTNVTLVAVLPGIGLGIAAAALVSHSMGQGEPQAARRWGFDAAWLGAAGLALLGVPMWLVPDAVLGTFVHDTATRDLAREPLRLVGLLLGLEALGLVLMHALLGAGQARRVFYIATGLQWAGFLPAAYVIGPHLGFGLTAIWIAHGVYRVAQTGWFFAMWRRGRWASSSVPP